MVTNMGWEGERLIHWLHERCGKSEEIHAVMKDDLAGGKLPSDDFDENAAWRWILADKVYDSKVALATRTKSLKGGEK